MMFPKSMKELKSYGVWSNLAQVLDNFEKEYEIGPLEMIMLLQTMQAYYLDMIVLAAKKQEEEEL
jgi:hypothetical protein